MYNLYTHIAEQKTCRKLSCGESLVTIFNCGLEDKYADLWSHYNYIAYVIEGRKVWHTAQGSYDLREGSCVFVRKGASIVEQFFDTTFCLFLFFIPDDFICDVLKNKSMPSHAAGRSFEPVFDIESSDVVQAFFQSMMPYFNASRMPDQSLLELKFRELILTIADDPRNSQLLCYFRSLIQEPQSVSMQKVMEDNFCFNLKMEEYARLCSRSLSAFKRDFQRQFNMSPGKWLLEKRLKLALHLLTHSGKTVSEAAFETGFENPSHFSRAFRQRFGASPTSARQLVTV